LTKEETEAPCPSLELVEELQKFCGMQGLEMSAIIQQILMNADIKALMETLERRGITVESSNDDPPGGDESWKVPLDYSKTSEHSEVGNLSNQTEPLKEYLSRAIDNPNALSDFIRDIESAASIENTMKKEWGSKGMDTNPLLSSACRADRVNAADFLPQKEVKYIRDMACGAPDQKYKWSFHGGSDFRKMLENRHASTNPIFPAIYVPRQLGNSNIYIYQTTMNPTSPEVAFLGELTVSKFMYPHVYSPILTYDMVVFEISRNEHEKVILAHEKLDECLALQGRPPAVYVLPDNDGLSHNIYHLRRKWPVCRLSSPSRV
jgi:hypothetical protein